MTFSVDRSMCLPFSGTRAPRLCTQFPTGLSGLRNRLSGPTRCVVRCFVQKLQDVVEFLTTLHSSLHLRSGKSANPHQLVSCQELLALRLRQGAVDTNPLFKDLFRMHHACNVSVHGEHNKGFDAFFVGIAINHRPLRRSRRRPEFGVTDRKSCREGDACPGCYLGSPSCGPGTVVGAEFRYRR